MYIKQLDAASLGELKTYLQIRDLSAAAVFEKLCAKGEIDPTLCFTASEEGAVKGGLAVCKAHSEGIELGAALLSAEDSSAAGLMLTHAGAVLRERGVPYLVAKGEQQLFSDWRGSEWIVKLGFVPPVLDESSLGFYGICLIDKVRPTCKPVRFPEAFGLPVPECRFFGINRMTDEQSAKAIVTTRERRRYGERIALVLFIILMAVIGVIKKEMIAIPAVGIALLGLWRNISHPKQVAAEWLEARRQSGRTRSDEAVFFGEDACVFFSNGSGSAIRPYPFIQTVYVKQDFLFLQISTMGRSARGYYIQSESIDDEQEFLRFLADKNPSASFKK